ncbi:MAG: translocation/assembly module TamB domain-containing protein [Bacteroidota bacterium]
MIKAKTIFKRTFQVLLYIFLVFTGLFITLWVYINTETGKDFIRLQAQNYLQNKIHTKVIIGKLNYDIGDWIEIKNIYIQDQKKDTLLFAGTINVKIKMYDLLKSEVNIKNIFLDDVYANAYSSNKNADFNYQFIMDAFSSGDSEHNTSGKSNLKINVGDIQLNKIRLSYKDVYNKNEMVAAISKTNIQFNKIDLDALIFDIKNISGDSISFAMHNSQIAQPTAVQLNTTVKTDMPFIHLNQISISHTSVIFDDADAKLFLNDELYLLKATDLTVNLNDNKIHSKEIVLDSTIFVFNHQPLSEVNKISPDSDLNPWKINAEKIIIHRSAVKYNDVTAPASSGIDYAHLEMKNIQGQISSLVFNQDSLSLKLNQLSLNEKSGFQLDSTRVDFCMSNNNINASQLYVKTSNSLIQRSINYSYKEIDDIINNPKESQFNLSLYNSYLSPIDLALFAPDLKKTLPSSFFNSKHLNISAEANGNLEKLNLTAFEFSGMNGSGIKAKATLSHLLDSKKLNYDLTVLNSRFLKKDIIMFVPKNHVASLTDIPDNLDLKGHFKGDLRNVNANINTQAPGFEYNGIIIANNIDNPSKIKYNVNTKSFSLDTKTILGLLPNDIKQNLAIPEKISASGLLKGNSENMTTDLKVKSSLGALNIKGFVFNLNKPDLSNYDLFLSANNFQIGNLIKDSSIGKLNGNFKINGTGFDHKKMIAVINADISAFEYNKYNYQNVAVNINLNDGHINSKGHVDDLHLKLNYDINADVSKDFPIINAMMDVDTAQLNELHLINDTLDFSGIINLNSKSFEPGKLDAALLLNNIHVSVPGMYYPVYKASIVANSFEGVDSIQINAPFAKINAGGKFDYTKIGHDFLNYFNGYYKIGAADSSEIISQQAVSITGSIIQDSIISSFLPDDMSFGKIDFEGNFDNNKQAPDFKFILTSPYIKYHDNKVNNINVNLDGASEKEITGNVSFDNLQMNKYVFHKTMLSSKLSDNKLSLDASMVDDKGKDWFGLSAMAVVDGDNYTLQLTNGVLLNYENWSVASDNKINLSPGGFNIHNFILTKDSSLLYVNSKTNEPKSAIDFDIDNFDLKSISSLLSEDPQYISGEVNVKMLVDDFDQASPSFSGKANIIKLNVMGIPIGNLFANAESISDNEMSASVALNENGNDLLIKANYFTDDPAKEIEAKIDIKTFNIKTIEAFTEGQLSNCKGNLRGGVSISGSFANPIWNGELFFDTTSFKIPMLGTTYKITDHKITLNYPKIIMNDIEIKDSLGHVLKVNGDITNDKNNELALGLNINAKDFVLVNAKNNSTNMFYGFASADIKIIIDGTLNKPNIEGDIVIDDHTDLTVELPESGYVKDDGNTVVRFVDRDTFLFNAISDGFIEKNKPTADLSTFLRYNVNLSVTKKANFKIIIDPSTGDEISVQGDAHLNAGVDPGGNILLTGNYELDKGYYILNYQLLKRQFNLLKGSNVNFAGAIQDAAVDISAEYISNAVPYDLLSNETNSISGNEENIYKQKTPFKVILHITGSLLKPAIGFDIQLSEESAKITNEMKSLIDNKLAQLRMDQATMNKQVFSLLLMNRFVSEQSSDFTKYSNSDFSDMAKKSVSSFLSSAVNDIAGDLLKGMDVDLNLNSYNDYTNGSSEQRTDLNIAITKSFFNNRLSISVGNNFGLSGQQAGSNSNTFRPDLNMAYKLSKDGKYMISAYSKNQFEIVLDGFVVETGVSFLVTLDYDTFKEFFGNKK